MGTMNIFEILPRFFKWPNDYYTDVLNFVNNHDVNITDSDGNTMAHLLCKFGFRDGKLAEKSVEILLIILEGKFYVNILNHNGKTAFHLLCKYGFRYTESMCGEYNAFIHSERAAMMLLSSVEVKIIDRKFRTALDLLCMYAFDNNQTAMHAKPIAIELINKMNPTDFTENALLNLCTFGFFGERAIHSSVVAEALIKKLVIVNGIDTTGDTALHNLCRVGFYSIISAEHTKKIALKLINKTSTFDLGLMNNKHNTVLHILCTLGYTSPEIVEHVKEVVLVLIDKMSKFALGTTNSNGYTALQLLCSWMSKPLDVAIDATEMALMMINKMLASDLLISIHGYTVLHMVCMYDFMKTAMYRMKIALALIRKISNMYTYIDGHRKSPFKVDEYGNTALHLLCKYNFKNLITAEHAKEVALALIHTMSKPDLVRVGEDHRITISKNRRTALQYLCVNGFDGTGAKYSMIVALEIISIISDGDLAYTDNYGDTALSLLCYWGFRASETAKCSKEVALAMINKMRYFNIDRANVLTILCKCHWTYVTGTHFRDVILAVIRKGCNVNLADKLGNTPLHYLCMKNFENAQSAEYIKETILAMLPHCNKQAVNLDGKTALDYLCSYCETHHLLNEHFMEIIFTMIDEDFRTTTKNILRATVRLEITTRIR